MERLSGHLSNSVVTLLLFFSLFVNDAYADVNFPLPPRFSANALASDYTVGEADVMLPVKGDSAHNLYIDPTLAYGSDNQGYADLGLGYRWIHKEAAILGGYLFGGYSRIDNNARLWVANPGIEALGSRWDAHLNGYAIMGERNQSAGSFRGPIFFSGHSAFAHVYYVNQHAGHGGDVQVGYQLFPQSSLKGYVGSYFFAPSQVSDVWGGAAGLEYWFDHNIKVVGSYTYDNVRHSTGALGIGVEFGGTHVHRSNPSLEERITDPVERYLSELGRGSAIPSRDTNTLRTGISTDGDLIPIPDIIATNIAFFSSPNGTPNNGGGNLTLANCTAEIPCGPTDFSQPGVNTLNRLLPNTTIYFNGGIYPSAAGATIAVNPGQSLHSRTRDYSQLATGDARSVFNGALVLNSNNILENIVLLPTGTTAAGAGISANNATNIVITGSQIGNPASPSYLIGVQLSSSEMTISNSNIFAGGLDTSGIFTTGTTVLTVEDQSTIDAKGTISSAGVSAKDTSSIAIEDSRVNAAAEILGAKGLITSGNADIIVFNTEVNANSDGNTFTLETNDQSSIDIFSGVLTATGDSMSAIATGSNIFINTTVDCNLNNETVPCAMGTP